MTEENIKKLALKAGFTKSDCGSLQLFRIIEKFAELVENEERNAMGYLGRILVAKEREVCAKYLDRAAKSIRARAKK
jgi:hypothetical protein